MPKRRNFVANSAIMSKGGAHLPATGKLRQQTQQSIDAEIDAWLSEQNDQADENESVKTDESETGRASWQAKSETLFACQDALLASVPCKTDRRKQTPQEKKIRDYQNQRKNVYGKNNTGARHNVRKKKSGQRKRFRRIANSVTSLNTLSFDCISDRVKSICTKDWEKVPDFLRLELFDPARAGSSRRYQTPELSSLQKEAFRRLARSNTLIETRYNFMKRHGANL